MSGNYAHISLQHDVPWVIETCACRKIKRSAQSVLWFPCLQHNRCAPNPILQSDMHSTVIATDMHLMVWICRYCQRYQRPHQLQVGKKISLPAVYKAQLSQSPIQENQPQSHATLRKLHSLTHSPSYPNNAVLNTSRRSSSDLRLRPDQLRSHVYR